MAPPHTGGGEPGSDTDPELCSDGEEGNSASGSLASLAIMPEAVYLHSFPISIYHTLTENEYLKKAALKHCRVFGHRKTIVSTVLTKAGMWAIILGTFSTA